MKYLEIVISFITLLINSVVLLYAYGKITASSINYKKFRSIALLALFVILVYFTNMLADMSYKFIILYFITLIVYKLYYKEDFFTTIFKTFLIYLVMMLAEFASSIVISSVPGAITLMENYTNLIKSGNSLLISILLFIVFKYRKSLNLLNKLCNFIIKNKKKIYIIIAFITFISFVLLIYYHMKNLTIESFKIIAIPIIFMFGLCVGLIYLYYQNKTKEEEEKTLRSLMDNYEYLLEKDRINRHEIINNLLILQSYPDKNTEEYAKILNNILSGYRENSKINYSSLYKLPKGIKGLVYYKIANLKDYDIKFNMLISSECASLIENLNSKNYYAVCKILGILIDNAIEATGESPDKEIMLDIYKEKGIIYIYLENTYTGNIDIQQINKKGYSSKGKNRGFGLFIVNKVVKSNAQLSFKQYLHRDRFISILTIKNPD